MEQQGCKVKIENYNEIVKKIAEQKGCIYLDLFKLYAVNGIMPAELTLDGVHLFPQSYDRWANEIKGCCLIQARHSDYGTDIKKPG